MLWPVSRLTHQQTDGSIWWLHWWPILSCINSPPSSQLLWQFMTSLALNSSWIQRDLEIWAVTSLCHHIYSSAAEGEFSTNRQPVTAAVSWEWWWFTINPSVFLYFTKSVVQTPFSCNPLCFQVWINTVPLWRNKVKVGVWCVNVKSYFWKQK